MPVLLRETLRWLHPSADETLVDCTVGFGAHASEFLKRAGAGARLIGLDVDGAELTRTRKRLAAPNISFHHANYSQIAEVLKAEGLETCDVIFADLGVSSMQVDDATRGISYKHADAPLDMRMDSRLKVTATQLLATLPEQELSDALADLADETDHQRIASWIVAQRGIMPLDRTGQLTRLIMDAKGLSEKTWRSSASTRYGDIHPAAQTFQALRMLVNHELDSLGELLSIAPKLLSGGGRIGIISFHSGEDRMVKRAFRQGRSSGVYESISEKVIMPRPAEVRANPRSASAKFRWAQKSTD